MFLEKKNGLLLFIFICFQLSFSQAKVTPKDSLEVYKDVQTYSKKHKLTKFLHQLVFKPIYPKKRKAKKVIQTNFSQFQGKIIRNINILH